MLSIEELIDIAFWCLDKERPTMLTNKKSLNCLQSFSHKIRHLRQ